VSQRAVYILEKGEQGEEGRRLQPEGGIRVRVRVRVRVRELITLMILEVIITVNLTLLKV